MHESYYADTDSWRDRTHILPEPDQWKSNLPHRFREDLVMTPKGLFIVGREDNYSYSRPATLGDANHFFAPPPYGQKRQGGVQLPCNVPFALLGLALSFFRSVWHRHRREDVLLLYLNENNTEYRLRHPMLVAAGPGFVDYAVPVTPSGWTHFGSIHSHGDEVAYQSATDASDDQKSPGLHIIIGSLEKGTPTLHCVFSHGGHCFPVPPGDVFAEQNSEQPIFPEQWVQGNVPSSPRPVRTSLPGGGSYVPRATPYTVSQCSLQPPTSPASNWSRGD